MGVEREGEKKMATKYNEQDTICLIRLSKLGFVERSIEAGKFGSL